MKFVKTFIFFLCLPLTSFAQTEWLFLQGDDQEDKSSGIVVDSEGYIYVGGTFQGNVDFDPKSTTNVVYSSIQVKSFFIQKLDKNQNLIWIKTFGQSGAVTMYDLHIDSEDNIYLCGSFANTADLDPGSQTLNFTSSSSTDGFVVKINTDGNLLWAKTIQGYDIQMITGITTDYNNNLYIVGQFKGTADLDPNESTSNETCVAGFQGLNTFFTKWNPEGNFIWGETFAGESNNGTEIELDGELNLYILGYYEGTMDVDLAAGVHNLQSAGGNSNYIVKLDPDRNLLWAKSGSGTNFEIASYSTTCLSATIDESNNLYISGTYNGAVDLGYGDTLLQYWNNKQSTDAFVQKLNPDGSIVWSKAFGSKNSDDVFDLQAGPGNKLFLEGHFSDTVNFNDGYPGSICVAYNTDLFLMSWNQDGSFNWVETYGGLCNTAYATGIAYDQEGSLYGTAAYKGNIENEMDQQYIYGFGNFDSFVVKIGGTTNLAEIENDDIAIYPIPATTNLKVQGTFDKISIYSIDGRFINNFDAVNDVQIDLSNFPAGVYQLVINVGNKSAVRKIVKI